MKLGPEAMAKLRQRSRRNMLKWLAQRPTKRLDGLNGSGRQSKIMAARSVEHILAAVDPDYQTKHTRVPRWINRRRLRTDIDNCGMWYRVDLLRNDPELGRQRLQRLQQFSRLASALYGRLNDKAGELAFTLAAQPFPLPLEEREDDDGEPPPTLPVLKQGLEALARFANAELLRGINSGPLGSDDMAPGVALIGVYLPQIYKKWFGEDARRGHTFSNSSEEPTGQANSPFIRFAEAVLRDLDIRSTHGSHFSRETISSYLRQARASPKRHPAAG